MKRSREEVEKMLCDGKHLKPWQRMEVKVARVNLLRGMRLHPLAKAGLELGGKLRRYDSPTEWEFEFTKEQKQEAEVFEAICKGACDATK